MCVSITPLVAKTLLLSWLIIIGDFCDQDVMWRQFVSFK